MKGNSELYQFVKQMKGKLIAAQEKDSGPSFVLEQVELEVSFVFDGSAKSKSKIVIVDDLADAETLPVHKARLRFAPLVRESQPSRTLQTPRYLRWCDMRASCSPHSDLNKLIQPGRPC